MYPNYTPEQFVDLYDSASTADYRSVFNELKEMMEVPVTGDGPGDDAEFRAEFLVGDLNDPRKVVIVFSEHGNLSFAYFPDQPIIDVTVLEPLLNRFGWVLVPPDAAQVVVFPVTGATVMDCFFSFV